MLSRKTYGSMSKLCRVQQCDKVGMPSCTADGLQLKRHLMSVPLRTQYDEKSGRVENSLGKGLPASQHLEAALLSTSPYRVNAEVLVRDRLKGA